MICSCSKHSALAIYVKKGRTASGIKSNDSCRNNLFFNPLLPESIMAHLRSACEKKKKGLSEHIHMYIVCTCMTLTTCNTGKNSEFSFWVL